MELKTTGVFFDSGKVIERRTQDVEPILEHVKAARAAGMTGSKDMRHAARIPHAVVENYLAQHNLTLAELMSSAGEKHWKAMLNDPDLSGFRIWKGRA